MEWISFWWHTGLTGTRVLVWQYQGCLRQAKRIVARSKLDINPSHFVRNFFWSYQYLQEHITWYASDIVNFIKHQTVPIVFVTFCLHVTLFMKVEFDGFFFLPFYKFAYWTWKGGGSLGPGSLNSKLSCAWNMFKMPWFLGVPGLVA